MSTTYPYATPRRIAAVSSDTTALAAGKHTPVNASGGSLSKPLPTGTNEGAIVSSEKIDASTNTVTLTGNIRGVANSSLTLYDQYETIDLVSDDNGSWWPLSDRGLRSAVDGTLASMPSQGVGGGRLYNATDDLGGGGRLYQDTVSGSAYAPVRTQGSGSLPAVREAISGAYVRPSSGYAYAQASKAGAAFGNAIRLVDAPSRLPAPTLDFTQPWTIEFYVAAERYAQETSEVLVGVTTAPSNTSTVLHEFYYSGTGLNFNYTDGSGVEHTLVVNAAITGTQHPKPPGFAAATYDGTTLRTFFNGALVSSVATTLTSPAPPAWALGGFPDTVFGGTFAFRGQIDELRVSNSCRYTAAYAPQTAPLASDSSTVLLLNGSTWLAAVATLDPNVIQQEPGGTFPVVGTPVFPDGAKLSGTTPQYNVTIPTYGAFWQDVKITADMVTYLPYISGQSGKSGVGLKLTPNNDGLSPLQVWGLGYGNYGSAFPLWQVVSPSIEFSGGYKRPDMILEWDPDGPMISQLSGPDTATSGDYTGDSGVNTGTWTDFANGKTHALRVNSAGSGGHNPFTSTYQWSMQNAWHQYVGGALTNFVPTSGFRRDGALDLNNVGLADFFGSQIGAGYSPGSALPAVSVPAGGTGASTQLTRAGDKIALYTPSYGQRTAIGASSSGMYAMTPSAAGAGTFFSADPATVSTPRASTSVGSGGVGDAIHPLSGAVEVGPGAVTTAPSRMLSVFDSSDWPSIYIKKFAGATQPAIDVRNSANTPLWTVYPDGTQRAPSVGTAGQLPYGFLADSGSGMWFSPGNGVALSTGGTKGLRTVSGKTIFGSAAIGSEIAAIFANGSASFGSATASGGWLTADASTVDAPAIVAFGAPGGVSDLTQWWNSRTGTQVAGVTSSGGFRSGGALTSGAAGPHLSLANITTEPTATSMPGGVLYVLGGALYFRGGSGHVTKIAEA